jgi:hypothetical protein
MLGELVARPWVDTHGKRGSWIEIGGETLQV